MNILFCCEGFIIDGVTSFNLYLSSAVSGIDHTVAVIGRWGGLKGFQQRHRQHGVKVLQSLSPTVSNRRLLKMGVGFKPDIIITDSRRSYPFALKLKQLTGAAVVTVFHDPPQYERTGIRSITSLIKGSDLWISSEKPILDELQKIENGPPSYFVQRPITSMVHPTPLVDHPPFRVLCLGRLSKWKSPGIRYLVDHADELKKHIPGLELHVVGGGLKLIEFLFAATRVNRRIGQKTVHIWGTRVDPTPFFKQATVVCAGATSAIEAILSNRPVIAFSGVWMGPVTEENLEYGAKTHFGERDGEVYTAMNKQLIYLSEQPNVLADALVEMYKQWDNNVMKRRAEALCDTLYERFDSNRIGTQFTELIRPFCSTKQ